MDVERIELVRREQMRCETEREDSKAAMAQGRARGLAAHRAPQPIQARTRPFPASLAPTGGERHGVDGASRGPARRCDVDRLFLEQAIEYAPGEGAVRPAALQ